MLGNFQSSSDTQQLSFGMKFKTALFGEGSIPFQQLNVVEKVLMLNKRYPVILSSNQFGDCQVKMSDSSLHLMS